MLAPHALKAGRGRCLGFSAEIITATRCGFNSDQQSFNRSKLHKRHGTSVAPT